MRSYTSNTITSAITSFRSQFITAPLTQLWFVIAVQVGIFVVLDRWILAVGALPQENYSNPLLLSELLRSLVSSPSKALVSGLVIILFITRFRSFWISWPEIKYGQHLRLFIVLLAFLLGWWYSTYDYNLFYNQAHYYDRLLLIALVLTIAWRPIFVLLFLLLVSVIIGQFFNPLEGSYSWAHPSMPLRMLTMFVSMQIFYALTGQQRIIDWVFLGLCIIAAHYWLPGIAKVALSWISYGHIYHILPNTYANGWLGFLDPQQISSLALTFAKFDWFIRIATLSLQLGALFLLWRRFSLFALLTGWSIFHVGIFINSGIFFWQWIIIELAIVWLIKSLWKNEPLPFLNRQYFALSIVLISTSMYWVKPVKLAWYDTPISYTYRYEAGLFNTKNMV